MKTSRSIRATALLAICATWSAGPGCDVTGDSAPWEDIGSGDLELFGHVPGRWPSTLGQGSGRWVSTSEVVVCFDQAYAPVAATLEDQAKSAMDEIEAASGVRFVHRGSCATRPNPASPDYIRVRFDDGNCGGPEGGCALRYPGTPWVVAFGQSTDGHRLVFLHEWFHALGFHHEHDRTDDGDACAGDPLAIGTDDYLTPFDIDSIMYYCGFTAGDFAQRWGNGMSYWDEVGLRTFYGKPAANVVLTPGGFAPVAAGPSSPYPTLNLDQYHATGERRFTRTVELRDLVPGESYRVSVTAGSPVYLSFHAGDDEAPQWTSAAATDPSYRFDAGALGRESVRISLPEGSADVTVTVVLEPVAEARYGFSGGSGADDSGHQRHATAHVGSGSVVTDGAVGDGFHFTGSDWFEAALSPATQPQALSISAWIRGVAPGAARTIASKGHGGDGAVTDYIFTVQDDTLRFFGNGDWHVASASLGASWTHVAVSYDGASVRFYVDGSIVAAIPSPGALYAGTSPLLLGIQGDACQCNAFVGDLDDVRVYDRVLADAEVAGLAATPSAAAIVPVHVDTPIAAPNSQYYFSTRNAAEAASYGWQQLGVAFYAFTAPVPGAVPVHQETPTSAPHTAYHLSTRSAAEAASYGWQQLGVAFYAFPDDLSWTRAVNEETPTTAPHSQYYFSVRSQAEASSFGWTQLAPAFHAFRP